MVDTRLFYMPAELGVGRIDGITCEMLVESE